MRILGIDPGYATTGFGLLLADRASARLLQYGAVTTPPGMAFERRLEMLYEDMTALIAQAKPDAMAIEELFFTNNITTGIGVAQARGVILCSAERAGIPIFEYSPSEVKLAVTGYGKAEKKQVMEMTKRILKLSKVIRPDDAADAVAVAICHAHSRQARQMFKIV